MVKRRGRVAGADDDPLTQFTDESASLWGDAYGEVARKLLTSAVRCFAANGFHATTTRDISTGAGLSPAALYVHFPSKEQLLFEIVRAGHEDALAAIRDPAIDDLPDVTARLRALVSRFVAWHARHHVVGRVCQYELSALTPEHYDHIRKIRRKFNEAFHDTIAAGVAEGAFAPVDVDRVVRAVLSLGIDVVRWYRPDGPDSPEWLGDFYAELALKMVAPTAPATSAKRTARPPGEGRASAGRSAADAAEGGLRDTPSATAHDPGGR